MTLRMITTEASDQAHDLRLKTDSNEVVIGAITIRMMQGLLFSHFAKRGRGRPKRNTEVPRLIRGFKAMVKASGVAIDPNEEAILLNQLLNKSLF